MSVYRMKVGQFAVACLLAMPCMSDAHSFFYTLDRGKTTTRYPGVPAWLKSGNGDDGYVRVDAVVDMPGQGCVKLGSKGYFSAAEMQQMSTSLSMSGLKSSLSEHDISLITIDGRANPGGCALISTLPMTVVPMALLEPFDALTPGNLTFVVRAYSTSDISVNVVGTAQTLLGVASVFATGGAASTLSTLTSNLAAPALAQAQKKFEESLQGITPIEARINMEWKDLRQGIKQIDIPFYQGESNWNESDAEALMRLQKLSALLPSPAYIVHLRFSYFRSVFDARANGDKELPNRANLASKRVIGYPRIDGVPNLLQSIDTEVPSFIQSLSTANTVSDWVAACDKGIEALKGKGLNYIDRGIAIKAFVDEATKGNAWSNAQVLSGCFANSPDELAAVKDIFGLTPKLEFSSLDVQIDDNQASYKKWLKTVVPSLLDLQSALTAPGGRDALIARLTGGSDIVLTVASGTWVDPSVAAIPAPSVATSANPNMPTSGASQPNTPSTLPIADSVHPFIQQLTSRRAKAVGCFVHDLASNDPNGTKFLIALDNKELWLADPELSVKGDSVHITKLTLRTLDDSWRHFFQDMGKKNWFPEASQSDCKSLLAML